VRPAWHFNEYFKVNLEVGYQTLEPKVAYASGGPYASTDRRNLLKVALAPALTPAPGPAGAFFTRPELRVFATYAKWNDAAQDAGIVGQGAACDEATITSAFGCDTHGFTFGAQLETWW
jgi:maltoporin